jgi:hypothetical protein
MNKTELILLGDEDATKVTFRMKKDLLRKLKVHAAQNDTNVTDILNGLIEKYLDEEERFGANYAGPSSKK